MKKQNFYLNSAASLMIAAALTLGIQSCSPVDNPIELTPEQTLADGDDVAGIIESAIAQSTGDEIVVNLSYGLDLELNTAVEVPEGKTLVIQGKEEAPATIKLAEEANFKTSGNVVFKNVKFDAADLEKPFIILNELAEGEQAEIDNIVLDNVAIGGLAQQFIYANMQKYLINNITVSNSIIAIMGAQKKTIFDFNGGGNVANLSIENSTISADDDTQWQNGGFYSSQSGQGVNDLGGDSQVLSITNSTLYNIAKGKTTSTRRRNSQSWQKYIVENSIIVNCGKSGQFFAGLNGGQAGKPENWQVNGNIINFDGEEVSATEAEKIKAEANTNIEAIVNFADPSMFDFRQSDVLAGDPRWIK